MSQRTLCQRLRRSCWPRNKCDVPKTTTAGAAAGRCRSSCVRTVYRLPPRVSAMHAPPGRDLFCVCPDPGRSLGAFCCAGVITLGGLNIQHTTSLLKLPPHRAIPSRGSAAVTRLQPRCYGSNRTEGCTTACEALGLVRPQREWTPFGPWILEGFCGLRENTVDSPPANVKASVHSTRSSHRAALLEHLFAGEVMKHLCRSGDGRLEVLKPQLDDSGCGFRNRYGEFEVSAPVHHTAWRNPIRRASTRSSTDRASTPTR